MASHANGPASMVLSFVAAAALAAASTAGAQAQGAATDLVGRNGQFIVKDRSGNVETVDSKNLSIKKEQQTSAPRAAITDAEGKSAEAGAKPAANAGAPANAKPDAPKEETPEQKAIRAADVEALRAMRKQGGAYFYTEDNKPVPFDEIDRRIESGEVEGLKAIGLHLEDWKPQTKSKASASSEAAPPPPPPPAPKETKKY